MSNRSLKNRRHEIYEQWVICRENSREAGRQLGIDNTAVLKYVHLVKEEILSGKYTPKNKEESTEAELPPVSARVANDRELRAVRAEAQELREKYSHTLEEIASLEARNAAILSIRQFVEPIRIQADPSKERGQAVAIIQASDWHVEERVDPSTVGWRNEYNPDIAEARARLFFQNALKLIRGFRASVTIDRVIFGLQGDLMSGYIHEELEEGNYLSPVEAIQFAKRLILGGLKLWREDGEFREIFVVSNFGNHGRTTKKIRVGTGHKNSYEWMMYEDLAGFYQDDPLIRFQTTNSYFNLVEAFGHTLRFHHGDAVKYGGGIGGLTVPLLRYIAKSNHQHPAHADFLGHFHQLMPYGRAHRFVVNGSLIGFNAYAQRIGASPEPPMQSFHLLDAEKGFTISTPIFCEAAPRITSARKGKRA